MKTLLKKSAIIKTISSKISTYLHEIDAVPQEDDLDFDDDAYIGAVATLARSFSDTVSGK